jgi:hypothetical protein
MGLNGSPRRDSTVFGRVLATVQALGARNVSNVASGGFAKR